MNPADIGRLLVVGGLVLAVTGAAIWLLGRIGIGSLPGDIHVATGNVRVYVPLATCLLVSIVATLVANVLLRR